MGMYDSVWARCPKCDSKIEFQSKSGECRMDSFAPHAVPLAVALDMHENVVECDKCGYAATIRMAVPISTIAMVVS